MSVRYETDRRRFVVRWRRTVATIKAISAEAVEFDAAVGGPQPVTEEPPAPVAAGDGV